MFSDENLGKAFDFVKNKLYDYPLGDTMGWAWAFGEDSAVLNPFAWEHLRNSLMFLNSTGSVQIGDSRTQVLSTTDSEPHISTNPELYERQLQDLDTEGNWDFLDEGLSPVMSKDEPKISEKIHNIMSFLRDQGIQEVYIPFKNTPLTGARKQTITPSLDCF